MPLLRTDGDASIKYKRKNTKGLAVCGTIQCLAVCGNCFVRIFVLGFVRSRIWIVAVFFLKFFLSPSVFIYIYKKSSQILNLNSLLKC